jgi:hypothetical protein
MSKELIIVRGLPGSGKSTFVKNNYPNDDAVHYEADMFFMNINTGEYQFNRNLLDAAHKWCFGSTFLSLNDESVNQVIVSNTFTTWRELEPYIKTAILIDGIDIKIVEMTSNYGSIHGVTEEIMEKMRKRWVPTEQFDLDSLSKDRISYQKI